MSLRNVCTYVPGSSSPERIAATGAAHGEERSSRRVPEAGHGITVPRDLEREMGGGAAVGMGAGRRAGSGDEETPASTTGGRRPSVATRVDAQVRHPAAPSLPLPPSSSLSTSTSEGAPPCPSLSLSLSIFLSLSLSQRAHQRAHRRISTFAGAAVACHAPPGRPAVATAGYDDVEQLASAHTADYSSPYLIHFCLYFLS